ncbi:MAG: hypothetical protein HY858_12955 [Candidatus Solibacter usitatus]|nr:hypothetical protein [Candidatus Solibacter usitatus]
MCKHISFLTAVFLLLAPTPATAQPAAGRIRRLGPVAGLDRQSPVSVQIHPATYEPIHFVWDAEADEGLLTVPTLTPAGRYNVRLNWREAGGMARSLVTTLDVAAPPPLRSSSVPPVILLNGFQFPDNLLDLIRFGTCPVSQSSPRSRSTFGEMENLLTAQGIQVLFFDNCVECRGGGIEECGQALGRFVAGYPTDSGQPAEQVDLAGHSMGGLIARAYLAGKKPGGGFEPPEPHRVRKLALLGTPNFGSYRALDVPFVSAQLPQMLPGSNFLWELATWNQGKDDLRGVDALALTGNACGFSGVDNAADGLVTLMSASIGFAREPERTRVLPYRHSGSTLPLCGAKTPLAQVDGPEHLTARALLSFLQDTEEWKTIGGAAAEDFVLLRYGAGFAALPGASRLISGAGVEWTRSPGANPANVFFAELLPAEATDLWFNLGGMWLRFDAAIPAGTTAAVRLEPPQ